MDSAPFLIVSCLLLVTSALLALRGWRWRVEPVTPACRRCGYDVSRRPSGIDVCSECGADLRARRAIVTTRRRHNYWLAAPAALILVLSAISTGLALRALPWRTTFVRNAPTALIATLARRDLSRNGNDLRAEWVRRGESAELYDHLLDVQGSRAASAWMGPGTDILIEAARGGRLSDAQRDRLHRQMFMNPIRFYVRTPIRQGDPLVIRAFSGVRSGLRGDQFYRMTMAVRVNGTATVDGSPFSAVIPTRQSHFQAKMPAEHWTGGADVAPGIYNVDVAIAREWVDAQAPHVRLSPRFESRGGLQVEVLPRDTPAAEPIFAPEQSDAVAREVAIIAARRPDGGISVDLRFRILRLNRSFSIYAIVDGERIRIGGIAVEGLPVWGRIDSTPPTIAPRPTESLGPTILGPTLPESWTGELTVPISAERAASVRSLTLVLESDPEPLLGSVDQRTYWVGRITYPNVPIQAWDAYERFRDDLTPPPTTLPYRVEGTDRPTSMPAVAMPVR